MADASEEALEKLRKQEEAVAKQNEKLEGDIKDSQKQMEDLAKAGKLDVGKRMILERSILADQRSILQNERYIISQRVKLTGHASQDDLTKLQDIGIGLNEIARKEDFATAERQKAESKVDTDAQENAQALSQHAQAIQAALQSPNRGLITLFAALVSTVWLWGRIEYHNRMYPDRQFGQKRSSDELRKRAREYRSILDAENRERNPKRDAEEPDLPPQPPGPPGGGGQEVIIRGVRDPMDEWRRKNAPQQESPDVDRPAAARREMQEPAGNVVPLRTQFQKTANETTANDNAAHGGSARPDARRAPANGRQLRAG